MICPAHGWEAQYKIKESGRFQNEPVILWQENEEGGVQGLVNSRRGIVPAHRVGAILMCEADFCGYERAFLNELLPLPAGWRWHEPGQEPIAIAALRVGEYGITHVLCPELEEPLFEIAKAEDCNYIKPPKP